MFTVLLSLIFTTCILAAPAPAHNKTSQQWGKFKENKGLDRFQSTLLNETILPFLNECYNNHVGQTEESLCSRYFDGILQLNSSDYIVNAPIVLRLRDEVNTTVPFCEQKHIFPPAKYFPDAPWRDLNNLVMCGKSCLEDDAITTKPICRFIAWMGAEIKKNPDSNIKQVVEVTPVVAAATAAPTKVSKVVNDAQKPSQVINTSSNKTDHVVKQKIQETIQADAIPEKSVNISKIPTKSSPPKNTVEDPVKIEAKQKSTNEAAVIPNNQIDQTNKLHESKEYNAPPAFNSNAPDPIESQSPKIKEDKPDSDETLMEEESNGDETGGDNENDNDNEIQTNVKTNNIGIANPENEHNHSSSQEIITSNVVPTTTTNDQKDPFHEQSGSNFFTYFLVGMFLCIAMYVFYHNKSKILALVLEGRRGDKGRSGRRKHTAAYRKLDSNLEEAVTSSARGRTTQIIY